MKNSFSKSKSLIGRIGKKVKNFSKRSAVIRRERSITIKIPSTMIMTFSSIAFVDSNPNFFDVNGQCFPLNTVVQQLIAEEKIVACLSDTFKSFTYYPKTKVISILDKDLTAFLVNKNGTTTRFLESLGVKDLEGISCLAKFVDDKKVVVERSGFAGVFHKFVNGAFVSGGAITTFTTTAASHVSGVTGLPLIVATPGIVIFTPLVGGIFFASLERLADSTFIGPVACPALAVARDICLIIPRIAEITLNHVFPGPLLTALNIDAPLNVTAYLRFGASYEAIPDEVKKGLFARIVANLNDRLNKLPVEPKIPKM